jgi:hypothetical protein
LCRWDCNPLNNPLNWFFSDLIFAICVLCLLRICFMFSYLFLRFYSLQVRQWTIWTKFQKWNWNCTSNEWARNSQKTLSNPAMQTMCTLSVKWIRILINVPSYCLSLFPLFFFDVQIWQACWIRCSQCRTQRLGLKKITISLVVRGDHVWE